MRLVGSAALLVWLGTVSPAADAQLERLLAGLSEQAEAFARKAPQLTAQETLRQLARKEAPKRKAHLGPTPKALPPAEHQTREVVSEYGWAAFKDAPANLHEFREVVSVDGRPVRPGHEARASLARALTSKDDGIKKRLLEAYAKTTLPGAVTDFGQLILLFTRRHLPGYTFTWQGVGRMGADVIVRYTFEQTQVALDASRGRQVVRPSLRGTISMRVRDGLPLRITLETTEDGETQVRDEGVVEYAPSAHGVLVPVSVVHRQSRKGEMMVENRFQYSPFRILTAASEGTSARSAPAATPSSRRP
jgi:hypothetical protein